MRCDGDLHFSLVVESTVRKEELAVTIVDRTFKIDGGEVRIAFVKTAVDKAGEAFVRGIDHKLGYRIVDPLDSRMECRCRRNGFFYRREIARLVRFVPLVSGLGGIRRYFTLRRVGERFGDPARCVVLRGKDRLNLRAQWAEELIPLRHAIAYGQIGEEIAVDKQRQRA